MIKARGENKDGETVLVIGLSHRNLELLRADQPIRFPLSEIGMGVGEIVICAGETEQAILKSMGLDDEAL